MAKFQSPPMAALLEKALSFQCSLLIALKVRDSKARGETPGQDRHCSRALWGGTLFSVALAGLSSADGIPQGSAALHLGLFCSALRGFTCLSPFGA